MVVYVLAVYEGATREELALVDDPFGYPHVRLEPSPGVFVDVENVPPEAPPVGRFPVYEEDGTALAGLVDFEPEGGVVTDGVLIEFDAGLSTFVDLAAPGRYVVQLSDTPKIGLRIVENGAPVDVSTATLKEMIFRRADGSALVRAAAFTTAGAQGGVDGRVHAQMQLGDLQAAGLWRVQARAVMPGGGEYHSRVVAFEVLHNLPTS